MLQTLKGVQRGMRDPADCEGGTKGHVADSEGSTRGNAADSEVGARGDAVDSEGGATGNGGCFRL